MKITVGPIPYLWEKDKVLEFYKELGAAPVAAVYIGEVACSKRRYDIEFLKEIASILSKAGKEVILTTFAIITDPQELDFLQELCKLPFPVEANNVGIFNMKKGDIIAGPHIPVYNRVTSRYLARMGIKRLVFMPELSNNAIAQISSSLHIEKEIIGFGNLPVASSWRCYTARTFGLSRSNCAITCKRFPEGLGLDTMDGKPLFNINGTQLMSLKKVCLLGELEKIKEMGIEYIRIIPQMYNTLEIIEIFHEALQGRISLKKGLDLLKAYSPDGISNGWFYGQSGWKYISKEVSPVNALESS